jgi:uncharacterized protein
MNKTLFGAVLTLFIAMAVSLGIYYEARVLGPSRLDVQRILIEDQDVPLAFDGVRIAFFSDLHLPLTSETYAQQVFETLQQLQPDIIIFGGDLLDASAQLSFAKESQIIAWLSSLHAPLGKFSLLGSADQAHRSNLENIYLLSQFRLLDDELIRVYQWNQSFIELYAVDVRRSMNSFPLASKSIFSILLSYDPNVLTISQSSSYSLVLAAKTHGGQLVIPFYGPLYPPARQRFYRGVQLENQVPYIVSNGLATLDPAYRLFTNPSLYIIELKKQP